MGIWLVCAAPSCSTSWCQLLTWLASSPTTKQHSSLSTAAPKALCGKQLETGYGQTAAQPHKFALRCLPGAFVADPVYHRRLDYLHDQNITYIGNEPAFLTVFQYHYAGRPALSAKRSHFYIPSFFSPTPAGLPGNDDSGAMGSFLAFSMIGLFPNPGQDVYLIIPPYFASVNITHPGTGKTASVRNINFDPTYEAIFIQSATLNGVPYTKNWVDHSFFTEGKELVLILGRNESSWGRAISDLPPSLGEYTGFNGSYSKNSRTPRRVAGNYWPEFAGFNAV